MSSGDDLVVGRFNSAQKATDLVAEGPEDNQSVPFNGRMVFRAGSSVDNRVRTRANVDGIHGIGESLGPLNDPPGAGVIGFGGPHQGPGVVGLAGIHLDGGGGTGVFGVGGNGQLGVVAGTGVHGIGGLAPGSTPENPNPPAGIGVLGVSLGFSDGVVGRCSSEGKNGVFGYNNNSTYNGAPGTTPGAGVAGLAERGPGVVGVSNSPITANSVGVMGKGYHGVIGISTPHGDAPGLAGLFFGNCYVTGHLFVLGGITALAVPHPDGSHRLLYSIESPESWFEDFGEAKLQDGKATVKIDPEFSRIAKTDSYHVFITSYGDSNGLYVSKRSESEFEVKEQNGGKNSLNFSYQIVAKPKMDSGKRLAKVTKPELSKTPMPEKPSDEVLNVEKQWRREAPKGSHAKP